MDGKSITDLKADEKQLYLIPDGDYCRRPSEEEREAFLNQRSTRVATLAQATTDSADNDSDSDSEYIQPEESELTDDELTDDDRFLMIEGSGESVIVLSDSEQEEDEAVENSGPGVLNDCSLQKSSDGATIPEHAQPLVDEWPTEEVPHGYKLWKPFDCSKRLHPSMVAAGKLVKDPNYDGFEDHKEWDPLYLVHAMMGAASKINVSDFYDGIDRRDKAKDSANNPGTKVLEKRTGNFNKNSPDLLHEEAPKGGVEEIDIMGSKDEKIEEIGHPEGQKTDAEDFDISEMGRGNHGLKDVQVQIDNIDDEDQEIDESSDSENASRQSNVNSSDIETGSDSDGDKKPAANEEPEKPKRKRQIEKAGATPKKKKRVSVEAQAQATLNRTPAGPSSNTRSSATRKAPLTDTEQTEVAASNPDLQSRLSSSLLETLSGGPNVAFVVTIQNGQFVFTTQDDDTPRPFFRNVYELAGGVAPADVVWVGTTMEEYWPSLSLTVPHTLDDYQRCGSDKYRRAAMWLAIKRSFSHMYQSKDQDWAQYVLKGLNNVMNYESTMSNMDNTLTEPPAFIITWEDLRP